MNRLAVASLVLVLAGAACHPAGDARSEARKASLDVAKAAKLHTAAGNRRATAAEARRLLALAPVPHDAQATSRRPAPLAGPALGTPETSSLVDVHRFWYVDHPVDAVWAYLKAHPPALQQSGSDSSEGPAGMTSEGLAWYEPNQSYAVSLELEVSIAPASHGRGTVIRADGMGEWLDPQPVPDAARGSRMRVEAGPRCPRSDRARVGVTNSGDDLTEQLLPTARPTGATICEYGGLNSQPPFSLGRAVTLDASDAARVADAYSRLPIAHTDGGVINCPADDESITVIALSYRGRAAVDLWAKANGCAHVSNGSIIVNGWVDLSRWIAPLRTFH